MSNRTYRMSAIALAFTAVAACGDRNDLDDDPVVNPAEEVAPAAVDELDIEDVALGRALGPDGRVVEELGEFTASDTVYVVVQTEGRGSATVTARWLFEDGQLVDETSQTLSPTGGETYTEFHIAKPDGWPAGEYEVKILVNGEEKESATFEIR